MAVLRQFALNLRKQDGSQGSLTGKRKTAAWDDGFRTRSLARLLPGYVRQPCRIDLRFSVPRLPAEDLLRAAPGESNDVIEGENHRS